MNADIARRLRETCDDIYLQFLTGAPPSPHAMKRWVAELTSCIAAGTASAHAPITALPPDVIDFDQVRRMRSAGL